MGEFPVHPRRQPMESNPIALIVDFPGRPDGFWVKEGCEAEPSAVGTQIRFSGDYPLSIELLAKVLGFPEGPEAGQPAGKEFDVADPTDA
jgi:hypothetical protein